MGKKSKNTLVAKPEGYVKPPRTIWWSRVYEILRRSVVNHAVNPDVLELAEALREEMKHRDAAEAEVARLESELRFKNGIALRP